MGQKEKIIVREADLGPVIARADHLDGAIEVNKDIFYKLPPKVQEFVLCHEVCHLEHNEWDENRTNALASDLYLSRAANDADLQDRQRFLSYIDWNGGYSNFAWESLVAIIPSLASLGYSVYGAIANQNAGWYKWNRATQEANLKTMLTAAFEQSMRSGSKSAAQFFWAQMQQCNYKDDSLSEFLNRSDNAWVQPVIAKYEKVYGFGFEQVTPIDITAYPLAMVAIGLVVGFVAYKIIKTSRK